MRKGGRRPTLAQKKIICRAGMDPAVWYTQKATPEVMFVVNQEDGEVRRILMTQELIVDLIKKGKRI